MTEYDAKALNHLKEEIARAAIRVSLEEEARKHRPPMQCFGDAKAGFTLVLDTSSTGDSDVWEQRLPPVSAATGPIATWYRNGELQPEPLEDVWATRYAPWFDAVEEVFDGWEALPDAQPLRRLAGVIEQGARALYIHVPGADHAADAESGLTDALSTRMQTIASITANFYGATAQTFHDSYSAHLLTVAGGQYQLTGALAAALESEAQIIEEAGTTVMGLAEAAVAAMRSVDGNSPGGGARDPHGVLNIVGIVAGAAANLFTKLNLAGTLTSAAIALFDEIFPPAGGRDPLELPLAGATADDVLAQLRSALIKLNGQMTDEEVTISTAAERAVDLSYDSPGVARFNLPPPVIATESDARLLAGDPPLMRKIGNTDMPWVAGHFERVLKEVKGAPLDSLAPWMRPGFIGFTDVGPHRAVSALYDRVHFLLGDTAGELRHGGRSFSLAADVLAGADAEAQRQLDKHAKDVEGVGAPDPGPPPREPDRQGGARA